MPAIKASSGGLSMETLWLGLTVGVLQPFMSYYRLYCSRAKSSGLMTRVCHALTRTTNYACRASGSNAGYSKVAKADGLSFVNGSGECPVRTRLNGMALAD